MFSRKSFPMKWSVGPFLPFLAGVEKIPMCAHYLQHTASASALSIFPKCNVNTLLSCLVHARGHAQRERETELLVQRAFLFFLFGLPRDFPPQFTLKAKEEEPEEAASAPTHESVYSPKGDDKNSQFPFAKLTLPIEMLSINIGSIKEALSLWPPLSFSCKCLVFVVPTGDLPHCSTFNFECTFANEFLFGFGELLGEGGISYKFHVWNIRLYNYIIIKKKQLQICQVFKMTL